MNTAKFIGLKYLRNRPIKRGDTVMFDIDNTLLDRETGKPFQPMIDLLHSARRLGYKIAIITARPDYYENQVYTSNELKNLGISYNTLGYSPAEKKTDSKKYLKRNNEYNFVLSVGDYWTDLTDSEEWIKLPDDKDTKFHTSILFS
jgi:hydroxymethylpyrimidine pyrophosphatase-like HAD family hydrolase